MTRDHDYDFAITAGAVMRQPDPPAQHTDDPPADEADSDGAACPADVAERYRIPLLRYFTRHLGNQPEVEDLTQDALLRYARSAPDDLQNPEPYLLRIAGNLLRDRHRRAQSHRADQHVPLDALPDLCSQETPTCEHMYEHQARLQRLQRALRQLSPRCRHVFVLLRFEGMTYTEAARKLGISVSSVEKHLMRAMLHINARMPKP